MSAAGSVNPSRTVFFIENSASDAAGGFGLLDSRPVLSDYNLTQNIAGGGSADIHIGSLIVVRSRVESNRASLGATYVNHGTIKVLFEECNFLLDLDSIFGGALYVSLHILR